VIKTINTRLFFISEENDDFLLIARQI